MRDKGAPGPLTPASAPQAPGRLAREDARSIGGGTLEMAATGVAEHVQRRSGAYWLPQRGTDRRLAVIFIAFSGTFAAISASFLPGGARRDSLVLFGDVLATAGLAYSVWGLAYLRRSFSIIPEARRLVTGGPYALSRHPVYLGEVITAIGINLATAGWLGALAIVYFLACELMRIRWEEGVLSRAFPGEYPDYAGRVPRYVPNPLRSRS